jgi:hypothetical protein
MYKIQILNYLYYQLTILSFIKSIIFILTYKIYFTLIDYLKRFTEE